MPPHPKSNPDDPTVFDQTPPDVSATGRASQEKPVGMVIDGRYFVERELGHGGIGVVYLARDQKLLDKPVVIKVLLEKALRNEYAVRKFQHEKEALARVDHPGIVGILDTGELPEDGKPYIVMQYVDGVTLRSLIRPEGIDLDLAANFIEQLGHALSAAHEEGLVHRDLKPENIMIQRLAGGRELVKVIDFGIAKVRDSQVAPSTSVAMTAGTFAYMSPEQLRGEKVTATSDIYALGVIAYELVTGRRPFNPETSFQQLEMQRAGVRVMPQDLRPALPAAAQSVILKALAFDPQGRYQSAQEFGKDFHAAIRRVAETSQEIVDGEARTKEIQQEKRKGCNAVLIIAAALVLFGSIGIGAWVAINSLKSPQQQQGSQPPTVPVKERSMSYWLTVQKMRDGKPYQEQFESSGQEIFENGWKFRFNASSPQPGFLYLLNEGPDGKGGTSYNLLYPTPAVNNGSAQLDANQKMQTGWYVFDDNQGTERFWIVWSARPVPQLEDVTHVVNPEDKGTIKDKGQADGVRDFLNRNSANKPEVEKDRSRKQTNVKGQGDLIVNLVELEHH